MWAKRIYIVAVMLLCFSYITTSVILVWLGLPTSQFNMVMKAFILALFLTSIVLISVDDTRKFTVGVPLLVFFAIYAVRLIYDIFGRGINFTLASPFYIVGYLVITVVPLVATFLHMRPWLMKTLHNHLLVGVIAANLLLTGYFVLGGVIEDESQFSGRAQVSGDIAGTAVINPIIVGLMGAFLFSMCIGRLLAVSDDSPRRQFILSGLAAYALSNVVIGGSRGPVVAVVLVLLCVAYLVVSGTLSGGRHIRRGSLAFGGIGMVLLAMFVTIQGRSLYLFERFYDMFEARAQGGREERDYLLADAWADFVGSPLIGESAVSRGGGHPHNFLAEALMSTGVAGTLFLTIAMALMLAGLWRTLKGRAGPYGIAVGLLTICYISAGLTSGAVGQYPELWAMMAIVTVAGLRQGSPLPGQMLPQAHFA